MEKSFGKLLQTLRKDKGWTQQNLADLLNVTNKTVSKWERNEAYPETSTLIELSKLFKISVDDLLNGREKECTGEIEQSLAGRMDLMNQWQIVKAGLFSKMSLLFGMTGFYGVYFYTQQFLPSFFLLICFLIASFAFVWFKQEKIKVFQGSADLKEEWIKWEAAVLACMILILPCINFPVKVETLLQHNLISSAVDGYVQLNGNTVVFLHLSFLNYLTWLPYLAVVALFVSFGFIYLTTKKNKKQLKTALCAALMIVLFVIARSLMVEMIKPYETMDEQRYHDFKYRYVELTDAFDVLPDDLSKIETEKVNEAFYGKARYQKYMNITKFDDAKNRVYYQISEQQEQTSDAILLGLSYVVFICAIASILKSKKGSRT